MGAEKPLNKKQGSRHYPFRERTTLETGETFGISFFFFPLDVAFVDKFCRISYLQWVKCMTFSEGPINVAKHGGGELY